MLASHNKSFTQRALFILALALGIQSATFAQQPANGPVPQQANGPRGAAVRGTPFPNGMCWKANVVDVHFNPDLAVELEDRNAPRPGRPRVRPPYPSMGDAPARLAAMQAAITDWNAALTAAGAKTQLRLVVLNGNMPPRWAAAQNVARCIDPDNGHDVYDADYTPTHLDGSNTGSTARPDHSRAKGLLAGWVRGEEAMHYEDNIDGRLAETKLTPAPNNRRVPPFIQEADILWFTHIKQNNNQCPVIQWNYDFKPAGPAAAPFYDYYSVMLHEVGHLLGLDHQHCAAGNVQNVMQPRIAAGVRAQILACEMATLKMLYGPGAPCK